MIGLTFITQFVYWYRDLKTPGLTGIIEDFLQGALIFISIRRVVSKKISDRRQVVKVEVKQSVEPTYPNPSATDYVTPYEQSWTDVGNLRWEAYDRKFEIQERWESNSNATGSGFQERSESNSNDSAIRNPGLVEYNPYVSRVRYSDCSKWNVNDSPIENPERMAWNSFEGGVRFSECIKNELSTTERPKVVDGSISQQYERTTNSQENDNERRRRWEQNEMDYMGQDSFQNILAKLERSLNG